MARKCLSLLKKRSTRLRSQYRAKSQGNGVLRSGVGRNHRGDLSLGENLHESVGVVCLVGNERPRIGMLEQRLAAGEIVVLSCGENELDGIAESIDECVNFSAQSAAGSTNRLRAARR